MMNFADIAAIIIFCMASAHAKPPEKSNSLNLIRVLLR